MTQAHKLIVYVTDFEGHGPEEAADLIESSLLRNFGSCVVHEDTKDIDWEESSDFNNADKAAAAFTEVFN